MTTRQQRFTAIKDENPGPGSYEVIPAFVKGGLNNKLNLNLTTPSWETSFFSISYFANAATRIISPLSHSLPAVPTYDSFVRSFLRSCTSFVSKSWFGDGLISFSFCARLAKNTVYLYTKSKNLSSSCSTQRYLVLFLAADKRLASRKRAKSTISRKPKLGLASFDHLSVTHISFINQYTLNVF